MDSPLPPTNIFVACFPKSGSTYVCTLLSEITGFPQLPAVQFYGQNEQDLFEPALQQFSLTNSVTQQHVKGTRTNVQLMKNYRIRPVILVRNIFDVVLSLHDHFVREDTQTPVGYVHQEYLTMSFEDRMWFLVNLHLPWYFHFFVSWQEASRELDTLWLTYEEFFAHPAITAQSILQFYGLSASADAVRQGMAKIREKNTRHNVGVAGRGACLPDQHRQAILRLAQAWRINPVRMHLIGIESQDSIPERPQKHSEVSLRQQKAPVWLDLGCGKVKQANFVGLDRYPLPGVDVIADLDQPLPFREDSVDLVYASHSLEHVADLVSVMKEIYRICKPGAQVCIVAPYYQQSLNLANPYHKQAFNEHTPRFWTNSASPPLAATEFAHPHAEMWGLSESDSRTSDLDLRCLRIEFFYFPAYRNLPPEEQRAARQKYLDVCDQIMFHLLVVKGPVTETEIQRLAEQTHYYDPPLTQIRRLREALELQEQRTQTLREAVTERDAELADLRTVLATTQAELQRVALEKQAGEEAQTAVAHEIQEQLRNCQQIVQDLHQSIIKKDSELTQAYATFTAARQEWEQGAVAHEAERQQLQTQRDALSQQLARFEQHKQSAVAELTASRRRRETWQLARFRPGRDLRNEIDPAFQQLKDDSLLFTYSLKGFRLQPSTDLRSVPFLAYLLDLPRPRWSGVLLAPILDFPVAQGLIGIEIVSPVNTIVTQIVLPLAEIDVRVPACFRFSPIADSHQGRFWLRVFVRDVAEPVRVFEWRKYRLGGLGPLQTRAFCGFLFT